MERERDREQDQQQATTGDSNFSSAPELATEQNFLQVRALMADIGALSLEDDESLEDDQKEKERNRELPRNVDGHFKELLQEAQREIEQLKRELKQVESVHKAEREGEGAGTRGRIGESDGQVEPFISAHLCLATPFFIAHEDDIQSSMQKAPVRIDLRERDLSHSGRVQSLPLICHAHLPHSEQVVQKTGPMLQTDVQHTTQLQSPDTLFSSFQNDGPNQNLSIGEA